MCAASLVSIGPAGVRALCTGQHMKMSIRLNVNLVLDVNCAVGRSSWALFKPVVGAIA